MRSTAGGKSERRAGPGGPVDVGRKELKCVEKTFDRVENGNERRTPNPTTGRGATTGRGGGLRAFVGGAADAEFLEPASECVRVHGQHFRRPVRPLDYPVRLPQHGQNVIPFHRQ